MSPLTRDLLLEAFEASPVGLELVERKDPDDIGSLTPLIVNQAACDAAGQDLKADIGKSWHETSPGLVDSDFARMFERCLETGEEVSWEVEYGDSRFARSWFRGSVRLLRPNLLLLMFENVTAEKAIKLELERSNAELDDFTYVASHDLKAPLRDVENLSSWLLDDLGETLPEKSQQHLRTLRGRVGRMERLLDDFLEYSRAGRVLREPEEVQVLEVLEHATDMAGAPESFTIQLPESAPSVHTPRQPLEVVTRNLIANAVKHHDREDGVVVVRVEDDGEAVRIVVEDDGPGIAPEYHGRVFRMFQSLKPRDEVGGTGLGLSLVRKHVRAHGGEVQLDSAPGEGARFTVIWPKRWPAE